MAKTAKEPTTAFKNRSVAKIAFDKAKEANEKNDNASTQKALSDAKATLDKTSSELARDNFRRIGSSRLNKAIGAVELIGNVAQPRSYSYSESDIAVIEKALQDAAAKVVSKFRASLIKSEKATGNAPAQSFFS